MLPVLALVGRPNVGKSTLFNRLTGTRDALVADFPGLTRDRLYGYGDLAGEPAVIIDTSGLTVPADELDALMAAQVERAVAEADVVVLMVDGESGCTPGDQTVAELVRRTGKPVVLTVNKSEGRVAEEIVAEFFALGIGDPIAISATRGDRIAAMLDAVAALLPKRLTQEQATLAADATRVAVIGKPNVGKSTLINRYLGEERLVTMDEAGTTRDSIAIPFSYDARSFVLVDTAGIRRKARVSETIEKFSIVKSLQAIEESDAVILLLDARDGVTEQDVSLLGLILERGRALTLGINKWDGLSEHRRRDIRDELDRQLPFLDFVRMHFVSAQHGSNIFDLLDSAAEAAASARADLPTHRLTEVLQQAVMAHPPPVVRRRRIKLSYAHQGGKRPPTIVLHGNQTERLPGSYRRYLVKTFRKAFRLTGTPIRLQLRTGENPFAGKRNRLTPRQLKRRQRLRRHSK